MQYFAIPVAALGAVLTVAIAPVDSFVATGTGVLTVLFLEIARFSIMDQRRLRAQRCSAR